MKIILVVAALAAALTTTGAMATPVFVTFNGTMTSGYDSVGLFGSVGSLVGRSFTSTHLFEVPDQYVSPNGTYVVGGTDYPSFVNPSLGAMITIDGKTLSIAGEKTAYYSFFSTSRTAQSIGLYNGSILNIGNGVVLPDLANPPITVLGSFDRLVPAGAYAVQYLSYGSDIATGKVTSLSGGIYQAATGAVPEPATWMMMLLGFGAIGYAMRRKTVLRYV